MMYFIVTLIIIGAVVFCGWAAGEWLRIQYLEDDEP